VCALFTAYAHIQFNGEKETFFHKNKDGGMEERELTTAVGGEARIVAVAR
jgi:hypothetical protein